MTKPRILTICHNHPSFHAGGAEIFGHDLFRAMTRSGAADGLFLACTNRSHRERRPGTAFQTFGRNSNELVLWTGHFDRFFLSQIDLHGIVPDLTRLLTEFRPDIVHLHHTMLLGVEILYLIRRLLPQARLVLTLHEYYAICPNDGQMAKAGTRTLCHKASIDACHGCFPEQSPSQFLLRDRHIRAMYGLIDHFIAPSQFLRNRYLDWGLPPERISVLSNGRPAVDAVPHADRRHRRVFGYFGNINPYKGTLELLDAARHLVMAGHRDFKLVVHGDALFQSDAFRQRLAEALQGCAEVVEHRGTYKSHDLPALMADIDWVVVPSVWWENAPLVMQEAFQHRRPIICSGIGGMAEMAPHGQGALHVRPGDRRHLAETMLTAMTDTALWSRLVATVPPVPTIETVLTQHLNLYAALRAAPPLPIAA